MPRSTEDLYGVYGSVPNVTPQGTGGARISANATPQEFGAGVGEATGNLGREAESIANKFIGMYNETLATDAETSYIKELGEKTSKYRSLEGLAAVNARPQYISEVADLRKNYRGTLPLAAQHSFDMLAQRHEAYAVSDADLYAASELKKADIHSATASAETAISSVANLSVAQDDIRFNNSLQDVHFALNRTMQTQGWDVGTGMRQNADGTLSFDENTPNGKSAKAIYDQLANKNISAVWENRFKALVNSGDVLGAYSKYKADYNKVPPDARLTLDAYFKPKVQDFQVKVLSEDVLTNTYDDYQKTLINSSSKFNIGNVKSKDDLSTFARPETPEDGVLLAVNNLRKNYSGLTLTQIANKWAPPSENDTNSWLNNVSRASGINPNAPLNLEDPATLNKLVLGIGTAEKTKSDLSIFTPEVINSGITKSFAGEQPNLKQNITSPTGALKPSVGNYIRQNYGTIIEQARAAAERQHPGDIEFTEKVQERAKFQLDQVLLREKKYDEAAQNLVYQGINGNFTNGVRPTSLEELGKVNPNLQDAIDKLQVDNPKAIASYNKMLMSNPTNKLGNAYQYLQQEAFSGNMDVNRLLDHVSDGSLTQEGFDKLKTLIKASPSPEEQSEKDQMKSLSAYVYDTISHSNRFNNNDQIQDSANSATLLIGNYIAKQKEKGISVATLTNPQNKEFEPIRDIIKQFSIPIRVQIQNRVARIEERLKTEPPLPAEKFRLPNETPEQYLQRLK